MASTCLSSRHLKRLVFAIGLIGISFASCRVFLSSAIAESAGTFEELKGEIKLLGCIAGVFILAAAYLGRKYDKKRSTFVGCGCLVCIGVALSFQHTLIRAARTAEGKSASGDSGSGVSVFGEPGSDESGSGASRSGVSGSGVSGSGEPGSGERGSGVSGSGESGSGESVSGGPVMLGEGGVALLNSKTVQQWVEDFDKPMCRFKDNDHWPWPNRPSIGFGGNGASIEPPPLAEILRERHLDRQAELPVAVNNCESEAKPMKCADWADPDVAKRYTCSTTTSACKTCVRNWFDIPAKKDVGDLFTHFQGDVGAAYCRCASMSTPGVSDVSTPKVSDVSTHEVSDASTSTHEFSDVSKPDASDFIMPEVSDFSTFPTVLVIVQVLIVLIWGVPLLREPDAMEFQNPTEDIEGAELVDAEVAAACRPSGAADPAVARSGSFGIIPQMRTVTCPPDATPGASVTVPVTVDVVVPAGIHPGMQFDITV